MSVVDLGFDQVTVRGTVRTRTVVPAYIHRLLLRAWIPAGMVYFCANGTELVVANRYIFPVDGYYVSVFHPNGRKTMIHATHFVGPSTWRMFLGVRTFPQLAKDAAYFNLLLAHYG